MNCHVSFGEEKNVLSIRVIVLEDTKIHQSRGRASADEFADVAKAFWLFFSGDRGSS